MSNKEIRNSILSGCCKVGYHNSPPEKVRRRSTISSMQLDCALTLSLGTTSTMIVPKPKDADYCDDSIPPLVEELEALILARVPRSDYFNFFLVNKHFLALLKSGELYKIRSELGLKELSVFVSPSGERTWWELDRKFKSCRKLPILPAEDTFICGDKYGYVAGGFAMVATGWEVMDFAERYNPETTSWEPLPNMIRNRRFCSGCYMDNKFYVIGGRNPEGRDLSCAEVFDIKTKTWELIPDMLEVDVGEEQGVRDNQSPPLIAVVNNAHK